MMSSRHSKAGASGGCLPAVLLAALLCLLSVAVANAQSNNALGGSSSSSILSVLQRAQGRQGDSAADTSDSSITPTTIEPETGPEQVRTLVGKPQYNTQSRVTRMAALQRREEIKIAEAAAAAAAAYTVTTADADTTTGGSDQSTSVGTLAMSSMYQTIFDRHNSYRARHQAASLTWSDTLAYQAQNYAAQCNFAHDPNANAGENLYAISDTSNPANSLTLAIDAWYNEVSMYNFNNPGFSSATGHFTQVVWRSSATVGCAVQSCNNGLGGTNWPRGNFVVCRYSPAGNVLGQFQQNVLPATANPPSPPANPPPSSPTNPPPANPPVTPPPSPPANPQPPSNPTPGQVPPATLPAGYKFVSPSCLWSVNQRTRLCMEDDGYLKLYTGNPAVRVWISPNFARSSFRPFTVTMQTSGELVVTDYLKRPQWQAGTSGRGVSPLKLVVWDEGTAVITDALNTVIWSSNGFSGKK